MLPRDTDPQLTRDGRRLVSVAAISSVFDVFRGVAWQPLLARDVGLFRGDDGSKCLMLWRGVLLGEALIWLLWGSDEMELMRRGCGSLWGVLRSERMMCSLSSLLSPTRFLFIL